MTLQEKLNLSDSKLNRTFKVAGTDNDRRRKLTNREIYSMNRSYQSPNIDVYYLAEKFNVAPSTIRYHVDPAYRQRENEKRVERGFNTGSRKGYSANLAEYKRSLIKSGKRLPASY